IVSVALMLIFAGCAQVKNIAYFQNKAVNEPEKLDKHAGIVIESKDMLSIVVNARNPELSAMFNLPVVSYQAGSEATTTTSQYRLQAYVVDNDGCINFPVLGRISVVGQTRWELAEHIRKLLDEGGYISDAVVSVEFMNFKVSVLGEVNSPGTYTIQGDKVTILQAISLARDLTIFGQRENVTVIREKEGERVMYEVNLCDVSLFKSPAYYLQQNDIVYVQPSDIKARQSTTDDKTLRMTSIVLSGTSVVASLVSLLVNILK
ncbi:MAG: polysaccharide biosynthesis/export family protein, partial [Candidatus Cryptobacteroides sp.]